MGEGGGRRGRRWEREKVKEGEGGGVEEGGRVGEGGGDGRRWA